MGKVCVGDVNLKQQWDKGYKKKAENILETFYRHEFNFEKEFSKPQYDLLWPRESYVGVQATSDDAQSWSTLKVQTSIQIQICQTVMIPTMALMTSLIWILRIFYQTHQKALTRMLSLKCFQSGLT